MDFIVHSGGKGMRNCLNLLLVLVLVVVFSGILQAQPTTTQEDRIRKLEDICKQQEEQIQKLQSRLGVLQDEESYKKYTEQIVDQYIQHPEAEEDAGVTAGYENGFFIRSADGKLELKINGFVQSGIGLFENNTFDNNSFYMNGVYLSFDAHLLEKWHAYININFANPSYYQFQTGANYKVSMIDAFVEYEMMPELNFRIGQTLVPFGLEGQYNEISGISIWGEPFTSSWSHSRDIGFVVHGVLANMVGYKVGIFNGSGINTTNTDDEFLMAAQARFYFCGFDRNQNSFFHIGFLRNRDSEGGPYSVGLGTPWGRSVFGYMPELNFYTNSVEGWRNAVDVGARFDFTFENGSNLRVEGEYMYSTWQREYETVSSRSRFSWLSGYGFWLGYNYRHCFDKENPESGLSTGFKFSYSDIDNEDSHIESGNIKGQTVLCYTFMLGYAFNKHVSVNFNWIIADLDLETYYGGTKEDDEVSGGKSGGVENAWFVQFTASW